MHLVRLSDPRDPHPPPPPASWAAHPLQASATSLKLVLPAEARPGLFDLKLQTANRRVQSASVWLNRPEVWWCQTGWGPEPTSPGWLRLFGRCLAGEQTRTRVE